MKKGNNIYKRKDGRWEARYKKGTKNGHTVYGYCYGKTYSQARAKQKEMESCPFPALSDRNIRFQTLCEQFLKRKENIVKRSTLDKYDYSFRSHVFPLLGPVKVSRIDTACLQTFQAQLSEDGLAQKTIKDLLCLVKSVCRMFEKEFPNLAILSCDLPKTNRNSVRVMNRQEQDVLVNFLLKNMDRKKFGILLTLMTGLRIGELCALQWKHISLDHGLLFVCGSMQRLKADDPERKTEVVIMEPKTSCSVRTIPLSPKLVELCAQFVSEDEEAFVLTGSHEYIEPRTMQNVFKQYVERCGLDGVHFHTLRHTFATRYAEAGLEIKSLTEILGHSSIRITLDMYVHSSMETKRMNMNAFERCIF